MYQLCSKITIYNRKSGNSYTLDFAESIEVSSSWDMLSSIANLTLPKKIYVNKNDTPFRLSWADMNIANLDVIKSGLTQKASEQLFEEGDVIKVEMGYNAELNTVFDGFISKIVEKVPIELVCIDAMYILDGITISNSDKDLTLTKLVEIIKTSYLASSKLHSSYTKNPRGQKLYKLLDFQLTIPSMELPGFSIGQKTITEVFGELKKLYGIDTFIQNGTVFCGTTYPEKTLREKSVKKSLGSFFKLPEKKKFGFQNNVVEDKLVSASVKATNLEVVVTGFDSEGGSYKDVKQFSAGEAAAGIPGNTATAVPLKIPLLSQVSKITGNTKEGRQNKKIKIQAFTNNEKDLKNIAKRKLDKIRFNGYSGYFVAFGKPFIQHGDEVEMQDFNLPARSGKFKVKRVDYSFGSGGFRQKIELHQRIEKK